MKRLTALLVFALALVSFGVAAPVAASGHQPLSRAARSGAVPGQYIVTLKPGVQPAGFLTSNGIATRHVFGAALNGFSAQLSLGQLAALKRNPSVVRIEQDQYVSVSATQSPVTWGLDRIDQRSLPLSNSYTYTGTASNVTVYIIDTGIQTSHPEFGGRASVGYDALGGNGQDCNGHGTHVAGTVGGSTYGVAKGVRLVAVRVLDCGAGGTATSVVSGINWVVANRVRPSVVNLSLSGAANNSVDIATNGLLNAGVTTVVAAGNNNADACAFSPARASGVLTVAASSSADARAAFSNYGACVELFAPGVNVTSAWLNSGSATISGTSQASPHVAGVAALYLGGVNPLALPNQVNSYIISNATSGVITGNVSVTPNRLLFKAGL